MVVFNVFLEDSQELRWRNRWIGIRKSFTYIQGGNNPHSLQFWQFYKVVSYIHMQALINVHGCVYI